MKVSLNGVVVVKAKQIYKAKALRGFRYVKVVRVRKAGVEAPHVDLREVKRDGTNATGRRCQGGIPRSMVFTAYLTCKDGRWTMPPFYSLMG
jgi:hypothetical protein